MDKLLPVCPFCRNSPYHYDCEEMINERAKLEVICLYRDCPISGIGIEMEEWQKLKNYKFDTSTYIVLDSKVRREAESGRFVAVNPLPAPQAPDEFDYKRVREWALSTPRKTANTAFTASTNRNVAYLIEDIEAQAPDELLVEDIAADICDTVSRLNGMPYTPAQWMGTARNAIKHFNYHQAKPDDEILEALENLYKHFDKANGNVTSIVSKEDVEKAREALSKYQKPKDRN